MQTKDFSEDSQNDDGWRHLTPSGSRSGFSPVFCGQWGGNGDLNPSPITTPKILNL